ncbi:AMP-binding protein [Actinomycetospora chlora]|uniref:AMP-binding protein n=1 Tax=Actinomycetospora chlora TaxID=663608 RepID=A0ABP9BU49_9PSEU
MTVASPRTVVEQTLDAFAEHGDRVAVRLDAGGEPVDWTYRDLRDRVWREARRLEGLGAGPGDTVAVVTGDDPLTFVLRWAVNVVGATWVNVADGYAADTLGRILDTLGVDLVLTDTGRSALCRDAVGARSVALADVEELAAPADATPLPVRIGPGDLASISLTSGSTGTPKGVPRRAAPPSPPDALAEWRDVVHLLCTPVAHVGGTAATVVLRAGGRVVLQPGFDAARVLAAVERERATLLMPLFPRQLVALLDHPDLPRTDTASLRSLRLGGSPASATRIGEAVERFGPIVSQVYGTIEATNIATISAEELARPELRGTVGRAAPGVELSLRDADDAEVPVGEVGEIWVRGPAVMPGYVGAPDDTAAVLRDGWLWTGDLGRLDGAGYLTLVGRTKELIYGERARIHPPDIEEVLAEHPAVASAAVFATRDRDGVEAAAAAVVPRRGRAPSAAELVDWVAARRGSRVAPSVVHLVDDLPTLVGGKVDRRALRERYSP